MKGSEDERHIHVHLGPAEDTLDCFSIVGDEDEYEDRIDYLSKGDDRPDVDLEAERGHVEVGSEEGQKHRDEVEDEGEQELEAVPRGRRRRLTWRRRRANILVCFLTVALDWEKLFLRKRAIFTEQ